MESGRLSSYSASGPSRLSVGNGGVIESLPRPCPVLRASPGSQMLLYFRVECALVGVAGDVSVPQARYQAGTPPLPPPSGTSR